MLLIYAADGVLSCEELSAALIKAKAPLNSDELETFAVSIDFKDDKRIEYCVAAQTLKCYGGGMQELVDKALERVMVNHRQVDIFVVSVFTEQDLAEINEVHADALKGIYGGTVLPQSDDAEGSRPPSGAQNDDKEADADDGDDGDDGDEGGD